MYVNFSIKAFGEGLGNGSGTRLFKIQRRASEDLVAALQAIHYLDDLDRHLAANHGGDSGIA